MKKVLFTALALSITMSAVWAFGTMDKIMKSWVGYSIDDVILKWGVPRSEKTVKNKVVYSWYTGPVMDFKKVDIEITDSETCIRTLYTDVDSKTVNDYTWDGDSCPFTYAQPNAKKWVNPENNPWDK